MSKTRAWGETVCHKHGIQYMALKEYFFKCSNSDRLFERLFFVAKRRDDNFKKKISERKMEIKGRSNEQQTDRKT